jgi:hypothetical protein
MNEWAKMITTFIIWGALAGILISTAAVADDLNVLALILGIAASIGTATIWSGSRHTALPDQQSMKTKRNARMSHLVDRLDDDEVYQLEELLAARRDEPYSGEQT